VSRLNCSLIKFGKRLQSLTFDDSRNTVTAHFDDNSSETGNLAIGCDGSKSKVREYIVGPEAAMLQELNLTMINFASAKYTAEQALRNRHIYAFVRLCTHPDSPGATLVAGG
jgi:2-polyprenyl-6-methoxyphenol hydroxylase-like FAD-dependent oxidoreductase